MDQYTVALMVDEGTVRRISYNPGQAHAVMTYKDGQKSFNKEGAIGEAKKQKAGWEASDQFIGRRLWIKVN